MLRHGGRGVNAAQSGCSRWWAGCLWRSNTRNRPRCDHRSAALAQERTFPPVVLSAVDELVVDKCPNGHGREQEEVSGCEQPHRPRQFSSANKGQEREKSDQPENYRCGVG